MEPVTIEKIGKNEENVYFSNYCLFDGNSCDYLCAGVEV